MASAHRHRWGVGCLSALAFVLAAPAFAAELIDAPGVNLVRGHCSACHSLSLVTSQRGDADFWLDRIRWMQEKQNLWPIPVDQETAIISYLSTNYAETAWGRRPNLPPQLRP